MTGSQGIAMMYKPVYLIFTTKMPGVAEDAAFCDPYPVKCHGSSGSDELSGHNDDVYTCLPYIYD